MKIRIAKTDTEIAACYPILRELRPHIAESEYLSRVRAQEKAGYLLAFVQEAASPVAVAGFRIGENLAWGRFLYVDDLVTRPADRSKGYGAALLSWLRDYAEKQGCLQLHLDSGIQRIEAHRFYEREGMERASFHFRQEIAPTRHSTQHRGDTSGRVAGGKEKGPA
jgi:GNAT superfamily N-acetyltransferase